MVRLDPVVSVLLGSVPGGWQQLLQHHQIGRRLVSNDLSRGATFVAPMARSTNRCAAVASRRRGHIHVDDLAELVDRTIDVPPAAADLHIRLIHRPAVTDPVAAGPGGVSKQRREAQHPPIDK
jgi:hypothetical protein